MSRERGVKAFDKAVWRPILDSTYIPTYNCLKGLTMRGLRILVNKIDNVKAGQTGLSAPSD